MQIPKHLWDFSTFFYLKRKKKNTLFGWSWFLLIFCDQFQSVRLQSVGAGETRSPAPASRLPHYLSLQSPEHLEVRKYWRNASNCLLNGYISVTSCVYCIFLYPSWAKREWSERAIECFCEGWSMICILSINYEFKKISASAPKTRSENL